MSTVEEVSMTSNMIPKHRTMPLTSASERKATVSTSKLTLESDDEDDEYDINDNDVDDDETDDETDDDDVDGDDEGIHPDIMKGLFEHDIDSMDVQSWAKKLGDAESVMEGMVILYKEDKETFFLNGHDIKRMLELRFSPEFQAQMDMKYGKI